MTGPVVDRSAALEGEADSWADGHDGRVHL